MFVNLLPSLDGLYGSHGQTSHGVQAHKVVFTQISPTSDDLYR